MGLSILFIAQLLSAVMGLYVQLTYAKYGSHWHENLFYSHFLSIPLFLPFFPSLATQFTKILNAPKIQPLSLLEPALTYSSPDAKGQDGTQLPLVMLSLSQPLIPSLLIALLTNAFTQFICIRGVNMLASRTSAVGVSIVLNVRKLVSLFVSIKLFGNVLPTGLTIGASIVFASAGLWAWEEGRIGRERRAKEEGEKKVQ